MGVIGSNCTCIKGMPNEQIFNDFFDGMRIKQKPSRDINELIKTKRSGLKEITDKRWLIIIENILLNEDQKEYSHSLWEKALAFAKESYSENMLYLTLFFFTEDDVANAKLYFKDLMLTVCGYKEKVSSDTIQKDFLVKVINLYIHIISKLPIQSLAHLSSNPAEFELIFNKFFSADIQMKYIEEIMMKDYTDEWVNYDKFFDKKYKTLINHAEIRNSMIKLAYEPDKQTQQKPQ